MSIENIEKRIVEAAREEAEHLVRAAEESAAKELAAAKAANEKRAAAADAAARLRLQQGHDQRVTAQKAANKLKLLTRRAGILGDIFEKAAERFVGDRGGAYREWLAAQLESVAGEKGTIVPARDDRDAIAGLFEGKGARELAPESLPLRGGFFLRGDKIDFDLSLDTLLAEIKTAVLPELAKRTFGGA